MPLIMCVSGTYAKHSVTGQFRQQSCADLVSAGEDDLTGLSRWPNGKLLAVISAVEATVPLEIDPAVRIQSPRAPEFVPKPILPR